MTRRAFPAEPMTEDEALRACGCPLCHGRLAVRERVGVAAAGRALMGRIGVYQWLASVAEKGPDKARLHIGLKAQDVRDAFEAEGVEPGRWALFCEDPILTPVEKTRPVERQATREVMRPRETITIEDGQAVLRIVEEAVQEPVFEAVPLIDAAGQPILREVVTPAPDGEPLRALEPAIYMAPVMETVKKTYTEMEPTGETRLGLRHDQLLMLFLAVLAEGG